jgi:translocation and assembly module TamB
MAARFSINGWAGEQPIALAGTGAGALTPQGFTGMATANGEFAGAEIATTRPVRLSLRDGVVESDGAARIGAGTIEARWRGDLTRVAIDATLHDAPLEVLTAGFDQPAAGTLSGTVNLSGARKSLAGAADLTFAQARLARRSRDAVDAHLTATLGGGTLRGKLEAKSQRGLTATLDAQIPMVAEAAPFQLVPVRGGVLDANWSVAGPVEGLWALFGPLDQSVGGQINGAGAARFANGAVTGDGKLTLSGGTFDDKLSGVRLRAIEAEMSFDDRGMTLDKFIATDGRQGRVTGAGRLNGQDDGKLDLQITNMRLVDRPDAHATGGGALALEWRNNGATLTGAITLNDAEIRVVDSGVAPVAQIDVIEINRPGPPARAAAKPVSAIPVKVDLRILAPGRVFTRTRGLEAEWSMDLALRGDLAKPALFGEARMLRGDFNLAGRRFQMDHGVIRFAGAAEDAEVDVLATADAPELTAKIALTGRALDPQIALSSDPPLPEDEILPQLLFGRSSRELSGFEAAQLAASLATLAGQSAFDIAGAARAAVALDRLEVREEAGGVLVAGGKYLTRDVYVEVSRGALGKTATSLEWQVRPRLFVISSFLASGDQQVAVRWRREY